MLELTDATYETALQKGKFLLMFYTDWCPLCPPIIGMLKELEQTEDGRFSFGKIEFHKNTKAAEHFGAFGIPLVFAVLDGIPLYGCGGMMVPEGYRMIVQELLYDYDEKQLDSKIDRIHVCLDRLQLELTE